jgi:hypothetical protein
VIFSVLYLAVRCLPGCLMVLTRRQASKDSELLVLRHENAVLRRQISRVRYQPGDRLRLAALSALIPRRRWEEVFAVTPATLLAWHRRLVARKWDYTSRRRPGRASTAATIRKLVIQMATDNPAWGHRRVQGELVRLGHPIAASTVWQILHDADIGPAPRRTGPTWKQFLTAACRSLGSLDDPGLAAVPCPGSPRVSRLPAGRPSRNPVLEPRRHPGVPAGASRSPLRRNPQSASPSGATGPCGMHDGRGCQRHGNPGRPCRRHVRTAGAPGFG